MGHCEKDFAWQRYEAEAAKNLFWVSTKRINLGFDEKDSQKVIDKEQKWSAVQEFSLMVEFN